MLPEFLYILRRCFFCHFISFLVFNVFFTYLLTTRKFLALFFACLAVFPWLICLCEPPFVRNVIFWKAEILLGGNVEMILFFWKQGWNMENIELALKEDVADFKRKFKWNFRYSKEAWNVLY